MAATVALQPINAGRSSRRVLILTAQLLLTALAVGACSADSTGNAPLGAPSTSAAVATTATTTTQPVKDCSPERMAASGQGALRNQGLDRAYLITLPAEYDGTIAMPLILSFHGFASNKERFEADTELAKRGAAAGFIVVSPEATEQPGTTNRDWNLFGREGQPDDFAYIHSLLQEVKRDLCIDADRVFAGGHSNGSAFAGFLACMQPYELAAIAMVSATVPASCPDGVAPSVLAIAGTADPFVKFGGGPVGNDAEIPGVASVIDLYASHYKCATTSETQPVPGIRQTTHAGCAEGSVVILDAVVDGVHEWPGGDAARKNPSNSVAGMKFSATERLIEFFTQILAA